MDTRERMSTPQRPPLEPTSTAPLAVPADFAARAGALGAALTEEMLGALALYLGTLLATNEQMNLTAITEPAEVWSKHALDSLTLVPQLSSLKPGARVVDVGSGGGLPAIPLAIARPDLSFTLVESTQKKAAFLRAVAASLGLRKVEVRSERAEQLAHGPQRERFDAVTARAVARLASLVEFTVPLVRVGGLALFIKGQRADEELKEAAGTIGRAGAKHVKTVETETGRVVVLQKTAPSPHAIPRR